MSEENIKQGITEDELRAQLVKLAADNDMYFVIWDGHFSTSFVGLRNSRKKTPEIYGAVYEMFYDVIGSDAILFTARIDINGSRIPWQKMLEIAKTAIGNKKYWKNHKVEEKA